MTDRLRARCRRVLQGNDAGAWTRPSVSQYPHQWNWDSGFVSLGWSTFDPRRAIAELESLFDARWVDGMIPHLHYDPRFVADYFPGPDWWPGAQGRVAVPGTLTSGISNPPVAVMAAFAVGRRAGRAGIGFWERRLEQMTAWLRWFTDRRALPGSPLPVTIHPWETGWDNSPRWDHLAAARLRPRRAYRRLDTVHVNAVERPTGKDYDSFMALVELIDGAGYDILRIAERSPFLVHDVVVNAIWLAAARAVNSMASALGRRPPLPPDEIAEFRAAFREVHWHPDTGQLLDRDRITGRPIDVPTAAGAVALVAGALDSAEAASVIEAYGRRAPGLRAVPTAAPGDWFDPRRYWRGPVWINVNWLVIAGMQASGLAADATRLATATLGLVETGNVNEYFDATDGSPAGIPEFSWSAALALDLLDRFPKM